ncbi:MAG: FkbM family methyltransferase [Solirubrobacterales bacterium]
MAAAVEHESIPYASNLRTILDVGAHQGQFALFALERFPAASIVSVEPLPGPRAKLRELTRDSGRVRILEVAASNRTQDRVAMHVSNREDSSSLQAIGTRQVAAFPGTEEVGRALVSVARLDSLLTAESIAAPALLKVDVQGHEYEALEGASGILHAFSQIAVEASFVELYEGQRLAGTVIAFLEDAGFSLAGVFDVKQARSGQCLQADFLFHRRDAP